MTPTLHPPLHVGQPLTRRGQKTPDCRITDFSVTPRGIVWQINGRDWLTLAEVFAGFQFEQ